MFALIKCSNVLLSGLNKRLLAIAIAVERSLAMTADELNEVLHANEQKDGSPPKSVQEMEGRNQACVRACSHKLLANARVHTHRRSLRYL